MTLDVASLRADTAGVASVIHFNNAGARVKAEPTVLQVASSRESDGLASASAPDPSRVAPRQSRR
jgi:hypothetical protein